MSLYVTRHGETDYNINNLVCGTSPAKLSVRGVQQAKKLATILQPVNYSYLYVSPLQRAIDTANHANVHKIQVIIEPRIREINFGIYEGVHRSNQDFLINKSNLAYRYPKGESFIELCKRVYEFLDEIRDRAIKDDVLLVCHGAVCRAIHSYFIEMTNDDIFHYQTANCQLLKYEYQPK